MANRDVSQLLERRTVLYSGRVQGVGFRYTSHTIARRHDVAGYVRNLPDGRVELVVVGKPRELDGFLGEVREFFDGHIRDEKTDVQPAAASEFSRFEIRRW